MILQRRNEKKWNSKCQFRVDIEGRKGRFFYFIFGNKWVYHLVLSFSYGVTFLIKFYTWQIFKLGVFLHVAMALIAGKGLHPPIIGLLNQNSQKRNNTQGSFIPLNTSTFCITLIFFFFFLATNHGAQKLSKTTTWPYKWTASSRKGQSQM